MIPLRSKDLEMEILCSIPPEPAYASLNDLAEDFVQASTPAAKSIVQKHLDSLKMKFEGIKTFNGHKAGRCVQIARESWLKMWASAMSWWNAQSDEEAEAA